MFLWCWYWPSVLKITLLLEFVAGNSNANYDVATINGDAMDVAHGIITDTTLF